MAFVVGFVEAVAVEVEFAVVAAGVVAIGAVVVIVVVGVVENEVRLEEHSSLML